MKFCYLVLMYKKNYLITPKVFLNYRDAKKFSDNYKNYSYIRKVKLYTNYEEKNH